ncbi:unnamed protein product [Blepharisma stoltei]|uniref:Uncharacterized protein n=1 Tax=Blepharisma stoltei TaxID=1481888 RepID=A0AAU9JJS3_9CILI|nr:unnamed protein product [Blepharisma stoltei]
MEHTTIIKLSSGWAISLPGILSQNSCIPLSLGQRLDMFIYEAISEGSPICQMKLMDSIDNEVLFQNSYGVFIIPLGPEKSWQYTTHEGKTKFYLRLKFQDYCLFLYQIYITKRISEHFNINSPKLH